jgi:2-polyprenyl-3-methyl-5-hydroxy-6-metoxy-1,4-benzoquinol methylase
MNDVTFTGERLHGGDERFAIDIARHRAAYEIARRHAAGDRVLDVGCGSGHGTTLLAGGEARVVGIDRVFPDASSRSGGGHFVLGDLNAIPLAPRSFDLVVSFQVIEHLEDPTSYVDALAELMCQDGLALVSTPNIRTSDGVNPYHVHEYTAEELAACLGKRFERVEVNGICPSEAAGRVFAERSRRIRRIMRLDPLRLRERLPRPFVEWLFAQFALLVRRSNQIPAGGEADVSWRDFPVGPSDDDCLDLLALCRRPR